MVPIRVSLSIIGIAALSACSSNSAPSSDTARDDIPETIVQHALESLASGQSISWQDRTTGDSGSVTPTRTFQIDNGLYCRDYAIQYSAVGNDRHFMWIETACREKARMWRRVSSAAA